jgi:hypothetical protein
MNQNKVLLKKNHTIVQIKPKIKMLQDETVALDTVEAEKDIDEEE